MHPSNARKYRSEAGLTFKCLVCRVTGHVVLARIHFTGNGVYREELEAPVVTTGSSKREVENTVFKELVPMLA